MEVVAARSRASVAQSTVKSQRSASVGNKNPRFQSV